MNTIPWVKLSEHEPPTYKKLWVWVRNDCFKGIYTESQEFIYEDTIDFEELPSHWIEINKPESKIQKVCF